MTHELGAGEQQMCWNELEEKEMCPCQELQESCQEERIYSRKMCVKFN